MGLGKNEKSNIVCELEYSEECERDCTLCTVTKEENGDKALEEKRYLVAVKEYKKAVFANPKNAEAWRKMGDTYSLINEYNNASLAYDKALSIDPTFGMAMFGKAKALKNSEKFEEAMELANELLEQYDDSNVIAFKNNLIKLGVKDKSVIYSIEKAIDTMTNKAYDITREYSLADSNGIRLEAKINQKVDFAKCMCEYCNKRYGSLGDEKVWGESILSSFYGAVCLTLLYYANIDEFNCDSAFSYLSNNINLDEPERNAERLLGISKNKDKIDEVWVLIYSYVQFCTKVIRGVEPVSDIKLAVRDASESAFVLGMLFAMRHNESEQRKKQREKEGYDESTFANFGFGGSIVYSCDGVVIEFGGLIVENGMVQMLILSRNISGESKSLWLNPVYLDGDVIGTREHIIDLPPDEKWHSKAWPMKKIKYDDSFNIDFIVEIDDENDNCVDRTSTVNVNVNFLKEEIAVFVDEE